MPYYEFPKQDSSIFITAAVLYQVKTANSCLTLAQNVCQSCLKAVNMYFYWATCGLKGINAQFKCYISLCGLFSTLLHRARTATLLWQCFFLPGGLNSAHQTLPNRKWVTDEDYRLMLCYNELGHVRTLSCLQWSLKVTIHHLYKPEYPFMTYFNLHTPKMSYVTVRKSL